MSRSYKRNPVYKDGNSNRRKIKKYYKKQANKKVRRTKISFSRKTNMYRKISETWNICDYRFYVPLFEISENKDQLNWWKKWYYRK